MSAIVGPENPLREVQEILKRVGTHVHRQFPNTGGSSSASFPISLEGYEALLLDHRVTLRPLDSPITTSVSFSPHTWLAKGISVNEGNRQLELLASAFWESDVPEDNYPSFRFCWTMGGRKVPNLDGGGFVTLQKGDLLEAEVRLGKFHDYLYSLSQSSDWRKRDLGGNSRRMRDYVDLDPAVAAQAPATLRGQTKLYGREITWGIDYDARAEEVIARSVVRQVPVDQLVSALNSLQRSRF